MKNLLRLFALLAGCTFFSNVPAQNWVWARSGLGDGLNEGSDVAVDPSGNVFITGLYESPTLVFGNDTLFNTTGGYDVYIVKYDGAGNVLWARSSVHSNSGIDGGTAIATDNLGNVYVTGFFQSNKISFGTDTLNNLSAAGNDNIFLVKYDAAGNEIWLRGEGGSGNMSDYSYGVTTDPNGNVLITGMMQSATVIFGSTSLTNNGISDVFLAKYDPAGNVLWATNAGGTGPDFGKGVVTDTSGNIYVTGSFRSVPAHFGTYNINSTNSSALDYFVAKFNSSGTVQWAKSGGGITNDEGYSIAVDAAENIYVCGYFTSFTMIVGQDTLQDSAGKDAFLVKYNTLGNPQWAVRAGDISDDAAWDVMADSKNNIYIVGGFAIGSSTGIIFGTDTFAFPTGGTDPMFVAQYDSSGVEHCASVLPSGGDDKIAGALDGGDNVFVSGDFLMTPFVVGSDTLVMPNSAIEDIFTARYSCDLVSSIPHAQQTRNEISIYPNPSNGIFNLDCGEFSSGEIVITDVMGKIVYRSTIINVHSQIELKGNASGIYFYQIANEKTILAAGKILLVE